MRTGNNRHWLGEESWRLAAGESMTASACVLQSVERSNMKSRGIERGEMGNAIVLAVK